MTDDPLAGYDVDLEWDQDPEKHPEWAPWRKLNAEWTPEDSLTRIDNKASFVFGNVALVGTVAAGLGLISGLSVPDGLRWLAGVAGGLLVLALLLALAVVMPTWRTSLPGTLSGLKETYERWIGVKGWLMRGSVLGYAAAFVAGVTLVICSIWTPAEPSLSITVVTSDKGTVVSGVVTAQAVDGSKQAASKLVAVLPNGQEQILASDVRAIGAAGALSVTLTANPVPADSSYRLETTYRARSGDEVSRSIEVPG